MNDNLSILLNGIVAKMNSHETLEICTPNTLHTFKDEKYCSILDSSEQETEEAWCDQLGGAGEKGWGKQGSEILGD